MQPSEAPPQNFGELSENYREVKHSVNNSIGVIMAMSELAQMNPANTEKLIRTVLDRGPKIVDQLQSFGVLLQALAEKEKGET